MLCELTRMYFNLPEISNRADEYHNNAGIHGRKLR
jgi:hypothetical protein